MKKRILVTSSHFETLCGKAKALLEENGCEVVVTRKEYPVYTFEEIARVIGDIDGVIAGNDNWGEEVFAIAPRLKAIAKFGVGVDNFDLEAARRRKIYAINAYGCNSQSVAELALGLMLAVIRKIPAQYAHMQQGIWDRHLGMDLHGKTVGIIGFNNIGTKLARLLSGFDVRILANDPAVTEERAKELGAELVPLDRLLAESDVVSLHIPGTAANYHFMDRARMEQMKPGAILINTARGAVVDADALAELVAAGRLGGAGLDVYETEPLPTDSPLLHSDRIICTPHTAAETVESYQNVSLSVAQDILAAFAGRAPKNWVNRWED